MELVMLLRNRVTLKGRFFKIKRKYQRFECQSSSFMMNQREGINETESIKQRKA